MHSPLHAVNLAEADGALAVCGLIANIRFSFWLPLGTRIGCLLLSCLFSYFLVLSVEGPFHPKKSVKKSNDSATAKQGGDGVATKK